MILSRSVSSLMGKHAFCIRRRTVEPLICENPECGKAITKCWEIPCVVVSMRIHRYCPECGIHAECVCPLPAMQEIYDLLYPWAGKRCPRCRTALTYQDNTIFDKEDKRWYHEKCVDEGKKQLEKAKEAIQNALRDLAYR